MKQIVYLKDLKVPDLLGKMTRIQFPAHNSFKILIFLNYDENIALDCEGGVLVDEHNPYDSQRSSVSSNYPQNTVNRHSGNRENRHSDYPQNKVDRHSDYPQNANYPQNTVDRHSGTLQRNQSPNSTLIRANNNNQAFRLTNQSPILRRSISNQSPTFLINNNRLSNHSSRNSGGSDEQLSFRSGPQKV